MEMAERETTLQAFFGINERYFLGTKLLAMKTMPLDSFNLCQDVFHVYLKMVITYIMDFHILRLEIWDSGKILQINYT